MSRLCPRLGWLLAGLLLVFAVWAQEPEAPAGPGAPAAGVDPSSFTSPSQPGYVLGPDDEIRIQVLDAEEISSEPFRIAPDGEIKVPLAGRIRAGGRTVEQLETALVERLRRYIREPQVVVTISEYRSQPVCVIGAVNESGVHQLQGRKTLVEVLSLAGGLREDAGYQAKITRRREWGTIPLPRATVDPSGQFSVAEVNLEDVMEARRPEQNILIMPYDVIAVPRAEMVYVVGAVERAGGFVLQEQETVSVLQALALAGGVKGTAARKHARILRRDDTGEERDEIAVNLKRIMAGKSPDLGLRRDDILFVPHSGGKAAGIRAAQTMLGIASGIAIWRAGR